MDLGEDSRNFLRSRFSVILYKVVIFIYPSLISILCIIVSVLITNMAFDCISTWKLCSSNSSKSIFSIFWLMFILTP